MAEINLIPREHVEARRIRRWMRAFGVTLLLVVAATSLLRAWLAVRLAEERPIIEQLRQQSKLAVERQSRLTDLGAHKAALEARLASLHALRDSTPWADMFVAIDGAYDPALWFDELAYVRMLPPDPAGGAAAPADAPGQPAAALAQPVPAHFDIKGHALEHRAIASFMRALGEQRGVGSPRLTDTGMRRYSTAEVVDFSLTAMLEPDRMSTP